MNEWLKKMTDTVSNFWKNSSVIKKIILFGVIAIVIALIIVTTRVSSKPSGVRLLNSRINDENQITRILDRISEENVDAYSTDDGYIIVPDERSKRKLIPILDVEGLMPSNVNPFESFYNRGWSTTDFEQREKLKQAITKSLKDNIEYFDDVISANVTLDMPKEALFVEDQKPPTVGVTLRIAPNSDLKTNRKRILGIQNMIMQHVAGLTEDNIKIMDSSGETINNFEGMAEADRILLIGKERSLVSKLEEEKRNKILAGLQKIATVDRIRDLHINIDMDMSEKNVDATEHSPIQIRSDNPDTPYDDSEFRDTLPISQQTNTKEWQGTGYNPEGPAGVEGQTPPVYSDMSNVIGKSTETSVIQNNVINTKHITTKVSPTPGKITVSFNVDGKWIMKRDPKTHGYVVDPETGGLQRIYEPVSDEDLVEYRRIVEDAIGFDKNRGDSVFVGRIKVDRDAEHEEFDAAYFKKQQTQKTILFSLLGVILVLVGFILFRIISKEMERRRRLREEELLRQQQAEREKALWEARDDANMQVTMSVEESRRAELVENAINMAKEHPEDVAMLIRTWLMEE